MVGLAISRARLVNLFKFSKDTRTSPRHLSNNISTSVIIFNLKGLKLSHRDSRVTLHAILQGMDGAIYTPHALEPLKFKLGLDAYIAAKLALKLHAQSARCAINCLHFQ
eukprot:1157920-Pelagomonas_calceolata.AAC.8